MKLYELLILLEYNRDITKQKLGDKLVLAAKQDRNQDIDTILTTFEEIDNTRNKQFILWIANQYIKGLFRLEDAPRVHDALVNFEKLKSWLPHNDIGRYVLGKLEDEIDKLRKIEHHNRLTGAHAIPIIPGTEVIYKACCISIYQLSHLLNYLPIYTEVKQFLCKLRITAIDLKNKSILPVV